LVHTLGLGSGLTINNFYDQNWQGSGLGVYPKNLGPPISTTVEASKFKFGIQLVLEEELAEKQHLRPKLAGVQARGASEKNWDPLFISATVEASNLRFGIQVGLREQLTKK